MRTDVRRNQIAKISSNQFPKLPCHLNLTIVFRQSYLHQSVCCSEFRDFKHEESSAKKKKKKMVLVISMSSYFDEVGICSRSDYPSLPQFVGQFVTKTCYDDISLNMAGALLRLCKVDYIHTSVHVVHGRRDLPFPACLRKRHYDYLSPRQYNAIYHGSRNGMFSFFPFFDENL